MLGAYTRILKATQPDLPADWEVYAFTCLPPRSNRFTHIQIDGAVSSIGKKGKKVWDHDTERSIILPIDEWYAIAEKHEEKHGT
jgi:hypothetical protein